MKQLTITAQVLEDLTAKAGSRLRSDQWVAASTQWVEETKGRQQGTENRKLLNLGAVMLNLDGQWDFLGSFRTDWRLVLREVAVEAWRRVHCGWYVVKMKGSKKGCTKGDHSGSFKTDGGLLKMSLDLIFLGEINAFISTTTVCARENWETGDAQMRDSITLSILPKRREVLWCG